jgi:transcriptional regulator with XRE-family HTH domain
LDLLRKAREESGLTKKAICDKLGKPRNYLNKVESGERRLDVVELFQLCDAMSVEALLIVKAFANAR